VHHNAKGDILKVQLPCTNFIMMSPNRSQNGDCFSSHT